VYSSFGTNFGRLFTFIEAFKSGSIIYSFSLFKKLENLIFLCGTDLRVEKSSFVLFKKLI
jgi:hypothetical protein